MTKIYFVRHAQPVHAHEDDRTRPLTEEGLKDSEVVLEALKDKRIDAFYCSPYKRSIDTIKSTAEYFGMEIHTDERLREREKGKNGNGGGGRSAKEMFAKRWADHEYHEKGGESIGMVQRRNIEAIGEIVSQNEGRCVVIGTHGTALSAVMNYFDASFGLEDFLRIIDFMPYIVEMDIADGKAVSVKEVVYIEKEFKG